jgi:tetratricopeptide (TPR) repeat protein
MRQSVACCIAATIVFLMNQSTASAKFIRPDLEKVPIARLIENLEEAVKKDEKNVQLKLNLARVHAMAYAMKADTLEVFKGKEKDGPWFGPTPSHVPFNKVQKTDDAKQMEAAKEHLKKALEIYQSVVTANDKNMVARIGYAWLLEQSGERMKALEAYRKLVDDAWEKEKDLKFVGPSGNTFTIEASGYLVALLDKDKDKDEIAKLNERIAQQRKLPRPITPIAIPLRDGMNASDLEARNATVAFDADGSGLVRKWSWITPDAGWLVFDHQGKGEITSALQMFGNVTFWLFWENGYHALGSLDNNHDGVLTGDELKGLAIWHDRNGDGISQPGEIKSLADYGIVSVSCRYETDPKHPDRIAWSPKGIVFRDGRSRPTFDLILRSRD